MKQIEWKDESGYSYTPGRRRGEVEPSVWGFSTPRVRVSVHRYVGIADAWFLSVHGDLHIDRKQLRSTDLEEAKAEALALIESKLAAVMIDLFGEAEPPVITVKEGATLHSEFDWYNLIDGGYVDPDALLDSGAADVRDAVEVLLRFRTALEEAGVIDS